jgi:pimeloyl-ACP methyl ester carboxylesterase
MAKVLILLLGQMLWWAGPSYAADLALEDCQRGQGPSDGRCGTLTVWENRQAASGREIQLDVVVMPALSRNPAPDPLFVLAGGPGQAATEIISQIGYSLRKIRRQRDLVFVDQRGTGDSGPLDCEMLETEEDGDIEVLLGYIEACVAGYDADLRYYTTPHAMDDLDQVRQALGYEQINLWGGSYGTRAALVYMRRYPESTRSAMLDGAAPLALTMPMHMAVDAQRALDRLFAACAADTVCAANFPDLGSRFTLLLDNLDTNPPKVPLQDPLSGAWNEVEINRDLVAGLVRAALYSGHWSSLVPLMIDRALNGDYQPLMGLGGTWSGVSEGISLGMQLAVLCSEDVARIDSLNDTPTFMGQKHAEFYLRGCQFFPPADLPDNYFEPIVSAVPTLVLSGADDPVTPPRWGEETARHLKNGRHLIVPGTAHNTMGSGCVPRLMAQFVDAASADSLDAACIEQVKRPPFFKSYTGP